MKGSGKETNEQTENSLFSFSILFGLNRVCFNSLWNIVYTTYNVRSVRMADSIPKNSYNIKMLFLSETFSAHGNLFAPSLCG